MLFLFIKTNFYDIIKPILYLLKGVSKMIVSYYDLSDKKIELSKLTEKSVSLETEKKIIDTIKKDKVPKNVDKFF